MSSPERLSPVRLGAWQFMADMPYNTVTLPTLWKILWILYNYQLTSMPSTGTEQSANEQERNETHVPESVDEIMNSIRGEFLGVLSACTPVHVHVHLYIYMYTCTHVHVCICTYVSLFIS